MTEKKMNSLALQLFFGICLSSVLLTGCVSPNTSVDRSVGSLRVGDDPVALQWAEDLKHSFYSKQLGLIETGRVRMLSGDFVGSSTNFGAVIDSVIERTENGPVIKVGDVGANVMAGTVTDDRTRAYVVPPYEFIEALHYQILNDVFMGRRDDAMVEARRTVFAQDAIAEKYGKDLEKNGQGGQSAALSVVDGQMKGMDPVLQLSRSSYENGLAWYLCGVLFELDHDQSNAALSFRKSWELLPGNPYVLKDFLRLIRTQDQEAYKKAVARSGVDPKTLVKPSSEIILLFEENFVPQRQSVKIPIPVPGVNTLVSADFPLYQAPAYAPMAVELRENGQSFGVSALALSVQSLAYRDLKEKMPGVVIRNVTRIGTRVAAQAVANNANDYAKYGVMLFNAASTLINRADTRAWYTLPMATQLYRGGIAPGAHTLEIRSPVTGYALQIPVTVAQNEIRLVWVADLGGNARIVTASLNGKGGPTTYQVGGSLLSGYSAVTLPGGPRTLCGGAAAN